MAVKDVDDYLANVKPSQRLELERIRKIIKQTVPEAEETIRYGMPAYIYKGSRIMEFAAYEKHMSLFGSLGEMEKKLSNYKLSHKGTLQFTESNPVPESIIKEILLLKVAKLDKT
jgi:uncharacterized protein YdhG (YjbR/CyaY superfamily)